MFSDGGSILKYSYNIQYMSQVTFKCCINVCQHIPINRTSQQISESSTLILFACMLYSIGFAQAYPPNGGLKNTK